MADTKNNFASLPATPLGSAKWIALIAALLTGSVLLWQHIATSSRAAAASSAGVKSVLHLESFVVNLNDPGQKAYLRIGIDLGLEGDLQKESDGGVPTALVRDTLLGVLTTCRPDDLLTADGKTELRQQLLQALQNRAPGLQVQEVYFTEFLIQR